MTLNKMRSREIFVSEEVSWMADKIRKSLADDKMTSDQFIDNYLRDKFTTEHPELVTYWEENQELRGENHRLYLEQEAEILEKLRGETPKPQRPIKSPGN